MRVTVRGRAERVEGRYVRQTGDPGRYAVVYVSIEPAPGAGVEFVDASELPGEFVAGARRGIEAALASEVCGGHPMVDVRVTLVEGQWHEVDSSPRCFEIAGAQAVRAAAVRAEPYVL